jgi:hypothetical protein
VAVVRHCDTVLVRLTNSLATPIDAAPFYLGPDGEIFYLSGYPEGRFLGLRLPPGATRIVSYTEDLSASHHFGRMYLVVLALAADPDSAYPVDLRALADPAPDGATRSGGAAAALVAALAGGAGSARLMRGSGRDAAGTSGAIVLPIQLEPGGGN